MFSGLTPAARRVLVVPSTRAEIMAVFQRAWTMPIRRAEPRTCGSAYVLARWEVGWAVYHRRI